MEIFANVMLGLYANVHVIMQTRSVGFSDLSSGEAQNTFVPAASQMGGGLLL